MACDGQVRETVFRFDMWAVCVCLLERRRRTFGVIAAAFAILTTLASCSSSGPSHGRSNTTPVKEANGTAASPQLIARGGPIRFEPSACLGFAPTGRWNGHTVFLDPGHGGADPGSSRIIAGRVVAEKQVTLAVGLRMLPLLRASGYWVVMSRISDATVSLVGPADVHQGLLTPTAAEREIEARNLCADAARADVLLALHMNAFLDPSANGAETLYCPDRPFAARSHQLAGLIQRAAVTAMRQAGTDSVDRGVLPDRDAGGAALTPETANYHHLIELGPPDPPWLPYSSRMPGALVEPAFVSNPGEALFVLGGPGQEALASAFVDALNTYFGRPGVA